MLTKNKVNEKCITSVIDLNFLFFSKLKTQFNFNFLINKTFASLRYKSELGICCLELLSHFIESLSVG